MPYNEVYSGLSLVPGLGSKTRPLPARDDKTAWRKRVQTEEGGRGLTICGSLLGILVFGMGNGPRATGYVRVFQTVLLSEGTDSPDSEHPGVEKGHLERKKSSRECAGEMGNASQSPAHGAAWLAILKLKC